MLHQPAWAVGSHNGGPPAGETPQIRVHPTHASDRMDNPVHLADTRARVRLIFDDLKEVSVSGDSTTWRLEIR